MFDQVTKKILLFLGNPKIKAFDPKNAKTVLIRLWAKGIGDSIISTGAIRELKKKYPHIKIYVMQRKNSLCVFDGNPNVEKAYSPSIYNYLRLRNKIDVYIDFKHVVKIRKFLVYRLLNPKKILYSLRSYKYGLKDADFSYYKDSPFADKFTDHGHDNVFNSFLAFDIAPRKREYDLHCSKEDIMTADRYWKKDKKRVILNIYGANRMLDVSKIISTMNNLQKDFHNLDILIPFSNKTKKGSLPLCYSSKNGSGVLNARLAYKTTPKQLFALVQSSDTVISVDTSIIHIASAFNKPTVCFIEKEQLSWRPISDNNSLILCTVMHANDGIKCYDFDSKRAENELRVMLYLPKIADTL